VLLHQNSGRVAIAVLAKVMFFGFGVGNQQQRGRFSLET
jgi:hypothetical protein